MEAGLLAIRVVPLQPKKTTAQVTVRLSEGDAESEARRMLACLVRLFPNLELVEYRQPRNEPWPEWNLVANSGQARATAMSRLTVSRFERHGTENLEASWYFWKVKPTFKKE